MSGDVEDEFLYDRLIEAVALRRDRVRPSFSCSSTLLPPQSLAHEVGGQLGRRRGLCPGRHVERLAHADLFDARKARAAT